MGDGVGVAHASKSGFEIMSWFAPFRESMAAAGVDSAIAWNLQEHARVFLSLSDWNRDRQE